MSDSTGRHSQLWSMATVLPAMHAGVSGRTRIRACSSRYPGALGAPSRGPENPQTPRVRIGNSHPASRSARAVLCGARAGSNSARSSRVTITRSCSLRVLTTGTSAPLTGRVSGKSTRSGCRSAVMVLTATSYPRWVTNRRRPSRRQGNSRRPGTGSAAPIPGIRRQAKPDGDTRTASDPGLSLTTDGQLAPRRPNHR